MQSKIEQVLTLLTEMDVACWVILVREGRESTVDLLLEREFIGESAFIFTPDRTVAVVASYDKDRVEGMEVITYTTGITDALSSVLEVIAPQKIYLNFSLYDHTADSLTHGLFLKFQQILNKTGFKGELLSSETFLEELRSVKTPEEIARIGEAVKITEEIFEHVPDCLREGVTEREVLETMRKAAGRNGCELAWDDPAVTFGLETELGHRISSQKKLHKNESIHIDFGVRYEGYCSDLQRVFFYGTPPEQMVAAFTTLRKAQEEGMRTIVPGTPGYVVDAAARKVMVDAGYEEYNHGLGHQIGRKVHDGGCLLAPLWERYEENARKQVRKGNVFTVEPSVSGEVNMGLEEDVVVRERAEYLSHPQKEIITV